MRTHQENRIMYLERKYSETNIQKGEILSPSSVRRINDNYLENKLKRVVDGQLNLCKNRKVLQDEVYDIITNQNNLQDLNRTARLEQIIAIIILFVWRRYNNNLKEDETSVWRKNNLDWRLYARVISNLLRETRKNKRL